MVRSAGSSPLRRPSNGRGDSNNGSSRSRGGSGYNRNDDIDDDDDDEISYEDRGQRSGRSNYESEEASISGKQLPLTPNPSFNNVVASFYNQLPESLRNMLPIGKEAPEGEPVDGTPPPDRRGAPSWQDVSFIYSIPGGRRRRRPGRALRRQLPQIHRL